MSDLSSHSISLRIDVSINTQLMDLIAEIIGLIKKERGKYDFQINANTRLQEDLDVWGDDAAEFLNVYRKKFNVDLTEFKFDEYFRPEGDIVLPTIYRLIQFKKPPTYKSLTIGDLYDGVKNGKLK